MKDLLTYILEKVAGEGTFQIAEREEEDGIVFDVSLDEDKRGIIIGKGGRNIQAIRDLLKILGKKENKRVYIKILD